jgi:hypothetical protein
MQQIRIQIPGPGPGGQGGPGIITRILLSVAAVIMLVSAAFLGALFFMAALGMFVVGSAVLWLRIWWARRQFRQAAKRGETPAGPRGPGDVIDGEYRVVSEGRDDGATERPTEGER